MDKQLAEGKLGNELELELELVQELEQAQEQVLVPGQALVLVPVLAQEVEVSS